jgi:phosphoribosylanthranilate isomerase
VGALFVKICGITNVEDARAAVEAGADAIGLIFAPGSPRLVEPTAAHEIASAVPAHVKKVGVFVNEAVETVNRLAREVPLDLVQLHGAETPEFTRLVEVPVIKAVRVRGAIDVEHLRAYKASAILLDTYVEGAHGGTGRTFDWDLARPVVRAGLPVLLSGGLTPENVAEAVRRVQPWGVDVSSGVESRPGRKDHDKVRAFIANAKGAIGG